VGWGYDQEDTTFFWHLFVCKAGMKLPRKAANNPQMRSNE
jgi:hypothetical protein